MTKSEIEVLQDVLGYRLGCNHDGHWKTYRIGGREHKAALKLEKETGLIVVRKSKRNPDFLAAAYSPSQYLAALLEENTDI